MTSRSRAVMIVAVAMWLAVVAGSSAAAWFVIDRAGRDVLSPTIASVRPLAQRMSQAATASNRPSGTASSPPRASEPTARTSPVSRISSTRDSIMGIGGTVGVSCKGAALTLLYATPRDGWTMELEREPGTVSVTFQQQQGGGEAEVHATCRGGLPAFETTADAGSGSADDS